MAVDLVAVAHLEAGTSSETPPCLLCINLETSSVAGVFCHLTENAPPMFVGTYLGGKHVAPPPPFLAHAHYFGRNSSPASHFARFLGSSTACGSALPRSAAPASATAFYITIETKASARFTPGLTTHLGPSLLDPLSVSCIQSGNVPSIAISSRGWLLYHDGRRIKKPWIAPTEVSSR